MAGKEEPDILVAAGTSSGHARVSRSLYGYIIKLAALFCVAGCAANYTLIQWYNYKPENMRFPALWSLLAAEACSSWVPAGSAFPQQTFEPRLQRDVTVSRAASNTSGGWPHGPFVTKGRDVLNSRGEVITWAGVNWPMSGMSDKLIRGSWGRRMLTIALR
jgi:hypothetical protein